MNVRYAKLSDEPRLREIYQKMCMPYDFPDVADPEFVATLVVVDESDTPVVAGLARKTVEVYGLLDPDWETPAWRFEALRMLHEAMRHELGKLGLQRRPRLDTATVSKVIRTQVETHLRLAG